MVRVAAGGLDVGWGYDDARELWRTQVHARSTQQLNRDRTGQESIAEEQDGAGIDSEEQDYLGRANQDLLAALLDARIRPQSCKL